MDLKELLDQFTTIPGVQMAIIVGRDGMLLEHSASESADSPETVAAMSRDVMVAAERMAADLGQGNLIMGILEFSRGVALVANVSRLGKLLLVAQRGCNFADLWNAAGGKFIDLRKSLQF